MELNENKCEGMIRLSELSDDYYYLDEDNYRVVGYNTQKIIKLGDDIQVMVKSANLLKKELDFTMAK